MVPLGRLDVGRLPGGQAPDVDEHDGPPLRLGQGGRRPDQRLPLYVDDGLAGHVVTGTRLSHMVDRGHHPWQAHGAAQLRAAVEADGHQPRPHVAPALGRESAPGPDV